MTQGQDQETPLSKAHLGVLFHALAGWIRTVRGDKPTFGRSTSSARGSGSIYREFWQPFEGGEAIVEDLIRRGFLFWGHNQVSVGLTRQTVHILDNSTSLRRLNPDFAHDWSRFCGEYTSEEIEAAMIVAELLSYKRDLSGIACGPKTAHVYHRFMFECLGQLFYPRLTDGQLEHDLHSGAKRVDIVFTNSATDGFFHRLAIQRIPCPFVFVECKNYSKDPGNPEIDQLAGRLSKRRGRLGLLLCRKLRARDRVIAKCRAVLNDNKSYILALDDEDLSALLSARAKGDHDSLDLELSRRFRELVS